MAAVPTGPGADRARSGRLRRQGRQLRQDHDSRRPREGALRVDDDRTMSPTATADVARVVPRMLREGCGTGVRHVVNTGGATWSAFAQEIVRRTGTAAKVTPCAGADHPTRAARPRRSAPDNAEVPAAFVSMPPWRDALDRHLRATKHARTG